MQESKGRFDSVWVEAVLECALEFEEAFLYVVIPVILVFGFFVLAVVIYQTLNPNAADLATHSDLLSIDPSKWFPRA